MRSCFRVAVTQNTGTLCFQLVTRSNDISNLVTDMVDTARRVLFQKACNWRCITQWFQQLDFGVWQLDEDNRHTMDWFRLWR